MNYERTDGGRLSLEASDGGRPDVGDGFWTYEAVLERLVEALRLWWRSPGEGRWPFASDAPWHLMTRRTRIAEAGLRGMDLQRRLQAEDDEEAKRMEGRDDRGPLTRDDVARRDEATEWLGWIAPDSRKVVVAALAQLAAGRTNVDWARVKRTVGAEAGNKGVYRRFSRAVHGVVERLNAA
jgi:hypothetical protein